MASGKSWSQPTWRQSGKFYGADSHLEKIVVPETRCRSRLSPIAAAFCLNRAPIFGPGSVLTPRVSTSLQGSASQTPSWFVSYLDCIIRALALVGSPESLAEAYGSYVCS